MEVSNGQKRSSGPPSPDVGDYKKVKQEVYEAETDEDDERKPSAARPAKNIKQEECGAEADEESPGEPLIATNVGVNIKQEVYEAETDEDGERKPSNVRTTKNIKQEECGAEADEESPREPLIATNVTLTDDEEGNEEDDRTTKMYDWDDPCWDHHFGMEDSSTRGSYSNRGRTGAVRRTLAAYGFRSSAGSKKSVFKGLTPDPCFEYFVRRSIKTTPGEILENGQIAGYEIPRLADKIRNSHQIEYLEGPEQIAIKAEDDEELVTRALSTGCLQKDDASGRSIYYTDLFFSFCRGDLEEGKCTWHCKVCKECMDWRNWHCKGCNKCQHGATIPCDKCNLEEYALWRSQAFGYAW